MMVKPSLTIIKQNGWERIGRWLKREKEVPLERPGLSQLASEEEEHLPQFVRECAVAMKYLKLLGELPWETFQNRPLVRAYPGPRPEPRQPYVAALLVKIDQGHTYLSQLRAYLVEHPALVWLLGFELVPSQAYRWGFDVECSVPSARRFGRVLRQLHNPVLQFLLDAGLQLLTAELPPDYLLGDEVSLDTKHILAWVRQNNLKEFVKDRYDKTQQPAGDPDCKLGCKRSRKQRPSAEETPPTPTQEGTPASQAHLGVDDQYYWGYASGIVVTRLPHNIEIVLAEMTRTFDQDDKTYFFPLMQQVERRLGRKPRFGALDAGFDAFYC